MENASKALIIAGAILLSILIIGLGMMIFNQAKDAMDGAGLSEQQIKTYNADWENYVGERITGANVRTLIGNIKSHNLSIIKEDPTAEAEAATNAKMISFGGQYSAMELDRARNAIKTGKTYKVEVTEYAEGLIKAITATEN